jgi:hypothetical protein
MSHGEVCVARGDSKILCLEIAFRFPVMMSGFFILVRGIMMMAASRMFTRHFHSPSL